VHAGLNKGEARNALARAVFFNRLGKSRPQLRAAALPGQRPQPVDGGHRVWNTVYLERAMNALRGHGQAVDDGLLQYLSPLGWEHINLTGDYLWRSAPRSARASSGRYGRCNRLSVLYFPFSETTPNCQNSGFVVLGIHADDRPVIDHMCRPRSHHL
jgi:hypothetical protein